MSIMRKIFARRKPLEPIQYVVSPLDPQRKFLEMKVMTGMYAGKTAVVANFPSRAAYYETLKGKRLMR